jgi:hypothetical protein
MKTLTSWRFSIFGIAREETLNSRGGEQAAMRVSPETGAKGLSLEGGPYTRPTYKQEDVFRYEETFSKWTHGSDLCSAYFRPDHRPAWGKCDAGPTRADRSAGTNNATRPTLGSQADDAELQSRTKPVHYE